MNPLDISTRERCSKRLKSREHGSDFFQSRRSVQVLVYKLLDRLFQVTEPPVCFFANRYPLVG
jgi:hypothetical protein